MLTHVIPILLLIGSLASGVTCFTWSGGPEANSAVRPCPGSNVTLDWTFSLSDKDRLLSVQWFLVQENKNEKVVGLASRSGSFLKFPDIKTRVEFLPPAGLRLYNVSARDLGTYTVHVTLNRNGRHDVIQRSTTLALPHKPYLSEGRLVASLEPRTVTVNGTSHARLACGTILNHQDANFSVVWKTPDGQTVPSNGHSDGVFHLLLANPVEGGAYHCHLHGVTSLTCQLNGTQSSAGRVEVDRLQTQLMVLQASAARHDRQLLHANYEGFDLVAALEREANDSLEVRAALDGLQAKTQILDTVNTELSNLTSEHTHQLNTFDKRLDTVDAKLGDVVSELDSVAARQKQGLDKVDAKLRAAEAERQQATATLGTLTADCREHSQQLQHLATQIERLTDTVGRQEQVIANLTELLEKPSKDFKEPLVRNCRDVKGYDATTGVKTVDIGGHSVSVYCDQTTDGGGWTVIQRRLDGSVDFFRNWAEYEDGFGDKNGEYWLGLRNIYMMTSSANYSLRVDLEDFSGNTAYAQYSHFSVSGPYDNYRLSVSGYSGTAGDGRQGLSYNNNMWFSTKDRDLDPDGRNCAESTHGGWWYTTCAFVNLNGRYMSSGGSGWDSVMWHPWKKIESLKRVEMKIRPA